MKENYNFQVDLRGIIQLLSDHLYSGPSVYVRELLQNAVDAISARRLVDRTFQASIRIEVHESGEDQRATLLVTDNGIGLTRDDVHRFLATIGQSSKHQIDRSDFIGQFGIGLLSCFMVCDEVVVITRSASESDSPSIEWKGRSDGTYTIRELDTETLPGTQVFLRGKPECCDLLEAKFVRDAATRFASHLDVEIIFDDQYHQVIINEVPPWRIAHENDADRVASEFEYGQRVFGQQFLDTIPLESDIGGLEGVAYVLPVASNYSSRRNHRVYLKGMLISENVDNLLPEWAFFVRCVVNSTSLRPTASREGFFEDQALSLAREELGGCIRRYLVGLADTDWNRLNQIIDLHYLPIKSLAIEDDDFFRMFIDWLPFETSMGRMTLAEYVRNNKVIRYVATRDQFRQVGNVASAQGICLINGGYVFDEELLNKIPNVFPDRCVEEVDVSELTQNFSDLDLDQQEECFKLLDLANLVLRPFKCEVDIRKYKPLTLPALYTVNSSGMFQRSIYQSKDKADELWSGIMQSFEESPAFDANSRLCLNYHNPLIQRLVKLTDKSLIKQVVQLLYLQSLMLGHYPLHADETRLLGEGLLGLIDLVVGSREPDV